MKDFFEALYSYLTQKTEVKEIVGNKIYPSILPQDAAIPAIVYRPISAGYDSLLGGDSGFVRQIVQIVCFDKTFKKVRILSRKVKKAIQDLNGLMGGLKIEAVFIRSDFELSSNTALKYNVDEYMSILEFEFFFNEK